MATITLVRPPSIVSAGSFSGFLTPPIGLVYIAASLRNVGHKVTIVDAVGLNPGKSTYIGDKLVLRGISFSEVLNLISGDTDLIGFSGMFSSDWLSLRPLVNMIGEKFRDKYFIAGGEHFTAVPEVCLEQCKDLDAISLGEGEETLVDLANAIDTNSSWLNIDGLVVRNNDKFIKTNNRKRITKLDEIPKPAWDLVPLNNYLDLNLSFGVDRGRTIPMLASRGCPFQCTFCSSPYMWGTRWIARDPKLVADEIEEYIEKYNIDNVDFYDLTAIVKKSWIIEFCNEIISRKLNITWQLPSGTRSEAIDDDVTPLLYKSGCRNAAYAPESGSERMLVSIKKKVKLSRMMVSLKSSVKTGLNVKMNIIIGFPNETHKDIFDTIWYLIKMSFAGAHDVSIGVFAPYPGSEIYKDLVKKGVITHDEKYWQELAYVDISFTKSFCNNISTKMLFFYNWLGIFLFYGSNYLFRPIRLYKTIKNIITNKHESRGEMALAQMIKRFYFVFKSSKKDKLQRQNQFMRFIRFTNKISLDVGNLLFLIFLISVFLSRLNSKIFIIDIFGQLSFQVLIFGILLFFILIMMKKFKISIICIIICILLSADILNSCNRCDAYIENRSENYNKIRLMTFNTGLINDLNNTYNYILIEKPDIVQFQETSTEFRTKLKSLQSLFPYNIGLNEANNHFSNIIISKYPLKNKKIINNYIIYTNVLVNEEELTIVGVHLFPPVNEFILNTYSYFHIKYSKAFKPRNLPKADFGIAIEQMSLLKNLFGENKQNLIIMGDLNMTAASKRFNNFLNEINLYTYISHNHTTWPTFIPKFLGIQIDHVLFSKNLKVIGEKTIDHSNSDHRSLLVDLAF